MGYVAAKAAMGWLGEDRAQDEELVAIVETDACSADAIQVVTGCTFGKGNFFFKDFGKNAFSFLSRRTGRGIRLYAKPGTFRRTPEYSALAEKTFAGTATTEELDEFRRLHTERTLLLLRTDVQDLYDIREVTTPLPPPAAILESFPCCHCGEYAMMSRLVQTDGGLLCGSCLAEFANRI